MCLLVKQPATTSFTDDFLADVYSKNQDGLGIMYAESGKVHVFKCLPANKKEFIDFYRKHADNKECMWHARMQTHGDIDLDNCHPYMVTENIWMAHNGILATGNRSDPTRSDTWHYIKNFLSPALRSNPDLMLDKNWLSFVGEMIGSQNKFGFVRSDGEIAVINPTSGVEFVGAWLSNTYAWTPSMFGFRPQYQHRGLYAGGLYLGEEEDYENKYWNSTYYTNSQTDLSKSWINTSKSTTLSEEERQEIDEINYNNGSIIELPIPVSQNKLRKFYSSVINSYRRHGIDGINQWVQDHPYKSYHILQDYYEDPQAIIELIEHHPDQAADLIKDILDSESVAPSMLS